MSIKDKLAGHVLGFGTAPLGNMFRHCYVNLSKSAILSMTLKLCSFQACDFTPHVCGGLTQLAMIC